MLLQCLGTTRGREGEDERAGKEKRMKKDRESNNEESVRKGKGMESKGSTSGMQE